MHPESITQKAHACHGVRAKVTAVLLLRVAEEKGSAHVKLYEERDEHCQFVAARSANLTVIGGSRYFRIRGQRSHSAYQTRDHRCAERQHGTQGGFSKPRNEGQEGSSTSNFTAVDREYVTDTERRIIHRIDKGIALPMLYFMQASRKNTLSPTLLLSISIMRISRLSRCRKRAIGSAVIPSYR
jgi:hypothetical protein